MSGARRAYAHLNLSRNPFGEVERSERGALVVTDLRPALAQLEHPAGVVQIVGDCGRGKTSHLLALQQHLPDAPYLRIDPEHSGRIPRAPMLLVDEVQWLAPRRRRRLFARSDTRFALGTHVDLHGELEAAGRSVLTLWPARELDADRLATAFGRRIEWARRGPGPVPRVPRHTIDRLLERAGDDVRTMEGILYEALQQLEAPGDIELP